MAKGFTSTLASQQKTIDVSHPTNLEFPRRESPEADLWRLIQLYRLTMEDPILVVLITMLIGPSCTRRKKATFSMPLAIPLQIPSILTVPPY